MSESRKQITKCWFAGSVNPIEWEYVEVVFARNHREAKKVVWGKGENIREACDHEFINLRLTRKSEHDHLSYGSSPYVLYDAATLRAMGWRLEGDIRCSSCGMAEWDGQFPVCFDCIQCNECGCNNECEENKQGGEDE